MPQLKIFLLIILFTYLHFKHYPPFQFPLYKPPFSSLLPLLLWGSSPTHPLGRVFFMSLSLLHIPGSLSCKLLGDSPVCASRPITGVLGLQMNVFTHGIGIFWWELWTWTQLLGLWAHVFSCWIILFALQWVIVTRTIMHLGSSLPPRKDRGEGWSRVRVSQEKCLLLCGHPRLKPRTLPHRVISPCFGI